MPIWIEDAILGDWEVGKVGFLVERCHINRFDQKNRFYLQRSPARANMSGEVIYEGWAGTSNEVSGYGRGLATIVKIAQNGRAMVRALSGAEEVRALVALGYEDLAKDIPSTSSYTVEMPSHLYEKISQEAKASSKTINQVIVERLQENR